MTPPAEAVVTSVQHTVAPLWLAARNPGSKDFRRCFTGKHRLLVALDWLSEQILEKELCFQSHALLQRSLSS